MTMVPTIGPYLDNKCRKMLHAIEMLNHPNSRDLAAQEWLIVAGLVERRNDGCLTLTSAGRKELTAKVVA